MDCKNLIPLFFLAQVAVDFAVAHPGHDHEVKVFDPTTDTKEGPLIKAGTGTHRYAFKLCMDHAAKAQGLNQNSTEQQDIQKIISGLNWSKARAPQAILNCTQELVTKGQFTDQSLLAPLVLFRQDKSFLSLIKKVLLDCQLENKIPVEQCSAIEELAQRMTLDLQKNKNSPTKIEWMSFNQKQSLKVNWPNRGTSLTHFLNRSSLLGDEKVLDHMKKILDTASKDKNKSINFLILRPVTSALVNFYCEEALCTKVAQIKSELSQNEGLPPFVREKLK